MVQHNNSTFFLYLQALGSRKWSSCQACHQIALSIGIPNFDPTISTCEVCSHDACRRTGFEFQPLFSPTCRICGNHLRTWLADCYDCDFFAHPFPKEVLDSLDVAERVSRDPCMECDLYPLILPLILPGVHIPCLVHTHVVTEVSTLADGGQGAMPRLSRPRGSYRGRGGRKNHT